MDILQKLQKLPEPQKKIIVWSAAVIIGAILFFFWSRSLANKIQELKRREILEGIKMPDFKSKLEGAPKPLKEDLEKAKELINEAKTEIK